MTPMPEPMATNPTGVPINANTAKPGVPSARRSASAVRLAMAVSVALACGLSWAIGGAATIFGVPRAAAAPALTDIGGRWTGKPRILSADKSRCGPEGCTLTLDIVPCAGGWCGIDVTKDTTCGGKALQLTPMKDEPLGFNGKLMLAEGTQAYVVEVVYRMGETGQPPKLHFVGDTGPELMMFRRSFPFQAQLARTGDAVCRTDKPVS